MSRVDAAIVWIICGLGGFAFALWLLQGCSAAGRSCDVIDVAHAACEVVPVRYRSQDGTVRTVVVAAHELERLAADAGVPCEAGCP
jgi:hypothetical protein